MASPTAAAGAPPRSAWLLLAGGLGIGGLSLLLSFRLPLDAVGVSLPANGPRMILAAAVGLGLSFGGALSRASGGSPLRDAYLFAIATGGAAGIAVALKFLGGGAIALAVGVGGALLFASAVRGFDGHRRIGNWGLGVALVAMLAIAVPISLMAETERAGLGGASRWLLGDFARGTGEGATAVGVAALALAAFVLWQLRGQAGALDRESLAARPAVGSAAMLLVGLAIGAGGPIAFVGWFAPWVVEAVAGRRIPAARQLALCGFVGAGLLMLADSLPRELIGGYAPPLNVSIAVVAIPSFLWWNRTRLRAESERRAGALFEGVEAVLIAVAALVLLGLTYVVTGFARGIT